MTHAEWVYNDGGRAVAGYHGTTGDCACRAIAIAGQETYQRIYEMINAASRGERRGTRKRGISSARTGIYKRTMHRVMTALGFTWTPTMQIGSGCTVHLKASELPPGRLVVAVSKHYVAVLDGVIHDTSDPSRNGTRCVYGYWMRP